MSDKWLEPIEYWRYDRGGWWASARNVAVNAPTKAQARDKLYRSFRRRHAAMASATFASLAVAEGSDV